ncbi:MAG: methyltransferase domain-containing protein [Prolixibacteraceae bacterium]|jgi:ubiquinone/menaquinone biosynthesis C-methylase UbiE|nr:methyltransferase domain-containing protein [Prolixibacteraceae bacterium]
MSVFTYFSSNVNKRAQAVFNIIAPVYRKIDFVHSSHYNDSIAFVNQQYSIKGKTVLDVGTGAGDWGVMYKIMGAKHVMGVDFAEGMLEVAKIKNPELEFCFGNAESLDQFADNSFDIVTASFVVHGVKVKRRQKMLSEMKRISKEVVVLHDFIGSTPFVVRVLEFLERSDYRNFKKNIITELEQHFSLVVKHRIKKGTGIYIGTI